MLNDLCEKLSFGVRNLSTDIKFEILLSWPVCLCNIDEKTIPFNSPFFLIHDDVLSCSYSTHVWRHLAVNENKRAFPALIRQPKFQTTSLWLEITNINSEIWQFETNNQWTTIAVYKIHNFYIKSNMNNWILCMIL